VTSLETERVEPTPRRIRVRLGDRLVADSDRAFLLIQYGPNGLPTYFVPREDVVPDVLTYKRVDTRRSSRLVEIRVGGETVACSIRPLLLFETSLPTRYYLPFTDVRAECLEPSSHVTRCPYKGRARYWSVRAGGLLVPDVAWSYPDPIPQLPAVKDLVCFFTERVDLVLDGVPQPRTVSPWSDGTADVIDQAADR